MSVDSQIASLIDALNRNTDALLKAAGSAPAATTEKPATEKAEKTTTTKVKKEEAPKITQDQVNAALIKIKDDFGMDEAKKVIKEVGKVEKMGEIKPADYAAVYDAAVKAHAELSAGGSGEGGDDL